MDLPAPLLALAVIKLLGAELIPLVVLTLDNFVENFFAKELVAIQFRKIFNLGLLVFDSVVP